MDTYLTMDQISAAVLGARTDREFSLSNKVFLSLFCLSVPISVFLTLGSSLSPAWALYL